MNRRIDIGNYEEWFIDSLDGTLTGEEQILLDTFLIAHPDLSDDLKSLQEVQLEAQAISYPDKDQLLIPSEDELNLMYLAEEGDSTEVAELSKAYREVVGGFRKTILQPNLNIKYPNPQELIQRELAPVYVMWGKRLALAASVVGVVFLVLFNSSGRDYIPREGLVVSDSISSDELLQADYEEFNTPAPEDEPIQVKAPVKLDFVSSSPLVAQENTPAPEDNSPSIVQEDQLHEEAWEDLAQTVDSADGPIADEAMPLLTEAEAEEEESAPSEHELAQESSPVQALIEPASSKSTTEYSSVAEFLKDKAIQRAEEKDLLAMRDYNEEDQYVRTSFRIGGIHFSRLKKRK